MKRFKGHLIDIIVDFDGTCVVHSYPRIGRDIGAQPVLKELVAKGHRLILFTMRGNEPFKNPDSSISTNGLDDAINWFKINDIPLFGIQTNPEQRTWTNSPKAHGQYIIDDTCAFMPLKRDHPHERLFIDWDKMRAELFEVGLL